MGEQLAIEYIPNILTPNHPKWPQFIYRMSSITRCRHDYKQCMRVLAQMPDIDAGLTLQYFQDRGAFCDCEILMNL